MTRAQMQDWFLRHGYDSVFLKSAAAYDPGERAYLGLVRVRALDGRVAYGKNFYDAVAQLTALPPRPMTTSLRYEYKYWHNYADEPGA